MLVLSQTTVKYLYTVYVYCENKCFNDLLRMLMGTWYMCAIIITTAYKGNLIAFMTLPRQVPRIDTLSQIVASGIRLVKYPRNTHEIPTNLT